MQNFIIDDGRKDPCNTCCCQPASARPGEISKWNVHYAPVIFPINATGLMPNTCFHIEPFEICNDCPAAQLSPVVVNTPVGFPLCENLPVGPEGITIEGDLLSGVDAPEDAILSFSEVPFGNPRHGRVEISESGTFVYRPHNGFRGIDRFFWQVSINGSPPAIQEVIVGVCSVATAAQATPPLRIVSQMVNPQHAVLSFGVETSLAAKVGDVYRLSIRQGYRDCDGCYSRTDCFDVTIGTC